MTLRFFLTLASCLVAATATAQQPPPVCGNARVVDGDGIVIGNTSFRLFGIDAPETDQQCLDAKCRPYSCGLDARDQLNTHIAGREVCCIPQYKDPYGRTVAGCSVEGEDLNAWLVREGLALDYEKFSRGAYRGEQKAAQDAKRGMWSGAFIAPWDHRHCGKQIPVLGLSAARCPNPSCAPPDAPPGCTIKGNFNNKGERIYHMQGQRNYGRLKVDGPRKRWFCSEAEAEASGYRRAR